MDAQTLHHLLMQRRTWPGTDGGVEFRETHASRVYLVGERVYKVKKPVNFGFLDFSTLERRRHFCAEEVRLNDRFAPGTYLGVAELREKAGELRLDGPGEVVEVAVMMKRLPQERMLDRLIAADDPNLPGIMDKLGRRLAELHTASPVRRGKPGSDRRRGAAHWRQNFTQSRPFTPRLLTVAALTRAQEWTDRYLRRKAHLLDAREAAGLVREGHGDLHSAHICLTEPLQIYDCIEFNPRFRVADTACDLAFLLMDLDFAGRRDLATELLAAYRNAGGPDPGPERLLTFYKVYRAWVRGKVDGLLAANLPTTDPGRAKAEGASRRYFNLALGYLLPCRLLLTCGLMGSGKSTLARALGVALGARVLRSDEVRKNLAGAAAVGSETHSYGAGIYDPAMTETTYAQLLEEVEKYLGEETVIVDAAFPDPRRRRPFLAAAAAAGCPVSILHCRCPEPVALERLARRQLRGEDISDGRPSLYRLQAADFRAPGPEEPCIAVDTTGDVDYTIQLLVGRLAEEWNPGSGSL